MGEIQVEHGDKHMAARGINVGGQDEVHVPVSGVGLQCQSK